MWFFRGDLRYIGENLLVVLRMAAFETNQGWLSFSDRSKDFRLTQKVLHRLDPHRCSVNDDWSYVDFIYVNFSA